MRRAPAWVLTGALTVAGLAAATVLPARAQEAPHTADDGHGHGAPAEQGGGPLPEGTLRFRALDLSAMFDASHGGQHEPSEIPLANRTVRMLLPGGKSAEAKTDADGRLTFPSEGVSAGDRIEFIVPDESSAERWPAMVGPPVRAGVGQPGELAFVKSHEGPNPVVIGQFLQTVTVPDREEGTPSVRVNLIAAVRNTSEGVWIGKKGSLADGTLRFRVPKGFTLVLAQVSGNDASSDLVDRPDGACDVVIRERFYPTAFSGRDQVVRAVLTGPYDPSGTYDFSFTADHPIESYRLNLERNVLHYRPSGDVELEDGGPNPEASGRETYGWEANGIRVGQTVGIRFAAGKRVDPRVWITLGALGFVIAGAAFLAKALATRTTKTAAGPAPASAAERGDKLADLDRRLQRGEITSFEHAARRKQIEDGTRAAALKPAHAAEPVSPNRWLDEIESRVDTADAETLRRDVRRLVSQVRGTGR